MRRGEVWWVSFEPEIDAEPAKQRPAVIISNDAANEYLNRVQILPLTWKIGRVYPSEAIVMVNERQGKAIADQLTTVSKRRLIDQLGRLSHVDMGKVAYALRVHLGLLDATG